MKAYKHTLQMYISGFILSIVLTFASYVIVQTHTSSNNQILAQPTVLITILVFAIAQLIVQLYFFLHLGEESKPRWRILTLLLAVTVVLIVVIGSIWIMANLDYNMTTNHESVNKYIQSQDDL
ncbi:MAG TPA: cytochrome o ubiquinol oxidase subunit IV [Candidatus Microsaccharimonas sp.]|nr:cytochrome o ubiquinol oxidase subunit IV [Candidatus Microsaccharimonas sp.]